MLDNGGVINDQTYCPLQLFHGLAIITLLVIDPSQAVDIKPVIGL